MEKVKQINIKNGIYYFHNDQINVKGFHARSFSLAKMITKRLTFITLVMWLLKELVIATILAL